VARKDRQLRAMIPVSHRNSSISRARNCRGNPRHDFKRHSCVGKLSSFFATASKDHGIATFETSDHFSLQSFFDNEGVDLILRDGVIRRALSGEDELTPFLGPSQKLRTGESIVNKDIAFLDALLRLQRDQP
jgi:hypothetical protein